MSRSLFRLVAASLFITVCSHSQTASAICTPDDQTDCVDRFRSYTGTLDFFASGGSFSAIDDLLDDRPDREVAIGEVEIPLDRIPPRAELVAAFLYFGGSLFLDNDGNDSPDEDVEILVPGSTEYQLVQGDTVYQSGAIPGFPEVSLYSVRADITDILNQNGGSIGGRYKVRDFAADIFNNQSKHTVANASFSIVLIFQERRLPPRTIVIFDGMQEVLGSTVSLALSGFTVSEVPSGSMTIYALEGDCNPGPGDCSNGNNLSGAERIRVSADKTEDDASCVARRIEANQDPITLANESNPENDIFNRTINTVSPPLTNVPGTDIDEFDITSALSPGDTCVTVEATTPFPNGGQTGELIGLAYAIVGIDVFAPELREDSRIEVGAENGRFFPEHNPGDPLRVSYVVSNTGNLTASGINLEAALPRGVVDFEILEQPEGALVEFAKEGGEAGSGRISVSNISVRKGESTSVVLSVLTQCPLAESTELTFTASVTAPIEGGAGVQPISSTTVLKSNRCGPRYFLFGDGGCQSAPFGGKKSFFVWLGLVLVAFVVFRKRRSPWLFTVFIVAFAMTACGEPTIPDHLDRPPVSTIGLACPDYPGMVIIPSINGSDVFCMDAYEATIDSGLSLGAIDQSNTSSTGDGSTTASAYSIRFELPVSGVSWYQANAACQNAGKRLCSADEWITACRGDQDRTYPYADEYDRGTCNGHDSGRRGLVQSGSMFEVKADPLTGKDRAFGCVSQHGVYDLSGNLWEWNSTQYLDNTRRGLAGGGYKSNRAGLRCVTDDNYALPNEANATFGFRCCVDYPLGF